MRRPIRIAGALSAALVVGGGLALAGAALAQEAPANDDPGGPLIDLDWSVALRGSYTADSAKGSRYEAIIDEPIRDGFGRLTLDDTIWRIAGPDLAAGEKVRVVGADGAVLKVEPA